MPSSSKGQLISAHPLHKYLIEDLEADKMETAYLYILKNHITIF